MPLGQAEKEDISHIIKVVFDISVAPSSVNDRVVRATETALMALQSCAGKTHALGTLLECLPKSTNTIGWLATCTKSMTIRHVINSDTGGIKSSMLCMSGMSQHKEAIRAAVIGF